jgi:transposase InsO family protein
MVNIFLQAVFRLHGVPREIVSDRDPRFTAAFWSQLFKRLGTKFNMSTANHPQTDGQSERANRIQLGSLRSPARLYDVLHGRLVADAD